MGSKIRLGVVFGGRSAEHEVSLRSARNVIAALDRNKYEAVLIGIDREGRWHLGNEGRLMLGNSEPSVESVSAASDVVLMSAPGGGGSLVAKGQSTPLASLDVVFPVLHGPNGEDGTIQGLLKLANIPFVGPSVLGSAVGMDKDVMKRLLREAGIPIGKFHVVHAHTFDQMDLSKIFEELGSPVFVKPANMGSSVGVGKANNQAELKEAVAFALKFDTKVVVEEFIRAREIEVAVLGNEEPQASVAGEIVTGAQHEFYSYDAKYVDCAGQRIEIPANLPAQVSDEVRRLAVRVAQVLCCEGMGRVDFFYAADGRILVNEINTIPGFTNISMYPQLWQATGIAYAKLIDQLIELAIERHRRDQRLLLKP